ncbi:MAG: hypothetical protein AMJ54_03160 [Deltaproteobacteria bacterium SG8_13]|nr:MAG: hypothetical protein AMJ54_03160 [Deltaproteobacteria bacterium SG8_13]
MSSISKRKWLAVFLGVFLLLEAVVFAQDARLTRITVSNTRDNLLLYLKLQGAFTEKMQEAILSGVPATFSYYVSLHRVRSLWFDKELADLKITNSIRYDNLKKEFTVTRPWKGEQPILTQSFQEAQRYMTEIDGLIVYPLEGLNKGGQYQIRTMAEMSKTTLPWKMHYVLFFVSLWDFETDWYTIDFIF